MDKGKQDGIFVSIYSQKDIGVQLVQKITNCETTY